MRKGGLKLAPTPRHYFIGLAKNSTLRKLEIFEQRSGKLSEEAASEFVYMFDSNTTLTDMPISWRAQSEQTGPSAPLWSSPDIPAIGSKYRGLLLIYRQLVPIAEVFS